MLSSHTKSSNNTIKIRKRKAVTDALLESFASFLGREPSTLSAPGSTDDLLSKITIKDIRKSKKVGSGGFGDVLLVEHPWIGKVALKRLQLSRCSDDAEDQRRRALREGQIWADLKHKNVLPCLGVLEAAGSIFLVSPFVAHGNLLQYIQKNPEHDRIRWIIQIAEAMVFLHSNGIVHGDLKAANVLISDKIEALLCDFGLAKAASADTSIGLEGQGSVRWESIELLEKGHGKTFASDVWAFGMVIYEVLSGRLPYYTYTNNHSIMNAIVIKHELPPEQPAGPRTYPSRSYKRLWQATRLCWRQIPEERCTMNVAWSSVRLAAGWEASVPHPGWIGTQLALSPAGNFVAYLSYQELGEDSNYNINVKSLEPSFETVFTTRSRVPRKASNRPAFSPNGRLLVLPLDQSCRLWDTQTWVEIDVPYPYMDEGNNEAHRYFRDPLWSHDSTMCIVSRDVAGWTYFLDAPAQEFHRVWFPSTRFRCLGITHHRLYTATTYWENTQPRSIQECIIRIETWHWRSKRFTRDSTQKFEIQQSDTPRLHFVPARNAVLGYGAEALRLWNVTTGELLWTAALTAGWEALGTNMNLEVTPNGRAIAILHPLTQEIAFFSTTSGANVGTVIIDAIGRETEQRLHLIDGKVVLERYPGLRSVTVVVDKWLFVEEHDWE